MTALLGTVLASTSSPLSAAQLEIVPGARAWTLYLDAQLLSLDGGNVPDALFAAAHAAMRDARLPRTRAVAFEAPTGSSGSGHLQDTTVPPEGKGAQGGALSNEGGDLDRMGIKGMLKSKAVDFELDDLWDEGAPLQGAEDLPVCVTVNLVSIAFNLPFQSSCAYQRSHSFPRAAPRHICLFCRRDCS